ncbi:MAG TPA: DnaJ domain-containing protein [Dokdonella sp.]|uniref:DnaJ domain-containing protein n=1 Tax=Dokdonella sp. TaxID=2291710 RepID=UPI002D80F678|nr:DnaJ domain-containing protein [Dokdonella sp.]HET9033540.1 DnaJ domain-containing protein [Dokdonella sp.]
MSMDALELALALHQAPIQRFALRERPLPKNLGLAIQIASASQPQLSEAAERFSESEETILEAVRFFLQQVLFEPGTDAYRIFGVAANAGAQEIREHHVWLQRWLHPDRRGEDWEAVLSTKVNWAWQQLRNEASRDEYDRTRLASISEPVSGGEHRSIVQAPAWTAEPINTSSTGWLKKVAIGGLLACCAVLVYLASTRQDRVDPNGVAMNAKNSDSSIRPRIPFAVEAEQRKEGAANARMQPTPVLDDAPPAPNEGVVKLDADRAVLPITDQRKPTSNVTPLAEPTAASSADASVRRAAHDQVAVSNPVNSAEAKAKQREAIAPVRPVMTRHAVAAADKERSQPPPLQHVEPTRSTPIPPRVALVAKEPVKPRSPAKPTAELPDDAIKVVAIASSAEAKALPVAALPNAAEQGNTDARPMATPIAGMVHAQLTDVSEERQQKPQSLVAESADSDAVRAGRPSASTAAKAPVVTASALSRFELARDRVTTMVNYFGSRENQISAWSDKQDQRIVERERNALQARNQEIVIDRFTLDPPQWRVTDTTVALRANYHVNSQRIAAESGKLYLDMSWHEGDWKITRFEVAPSQ